MIVFKSKNAKLDFSQMILNADPDKDGKFLVNFQQHGDLHQSFQHKVYEQISEIKLVINGDHIYTIVYVKEGGCVDFYTDMVFRKRLKAKDIQ